MEIENDAPYIPVLDDPFSMQEMMEAVEGGNKNKSYSGICPGIVKILPELWLSFFLFIFNIVFMNMCYPVMWCYTKLVQLFKSGNRMSCDNYRGISIMDTLAKVYDTLIYNRLRLWCSISKCQAGAQKKRSCIEQILSLRLLCDFAICKKVKLYVLFIDFSKAYDRVPRDKMIGVLSNMGCGKRMLLALRAMYKCTRQLLKSVVVITTIGVCQGAPTSCLLFILYIDRLVSMLRDGIGTDGFLGGLHALLLMDDTVILATSRKMCLRKLKVLCQYCHECGMVINERKTKFFVINGDRCDREEIVVENTSVTYTDRYLYLGAWFTSSGKMNDVITLLQEQSEAIVNKFAIFCASNSQMPYICKRKVFDAAVIASLSYSSESWLTNNIKTIEKQYNKLIKCLLGVRKNTSINLCMLEKGITPLNEVLCKKRRTFLLSKLERVDNEEPFSFVFYMCKNHRTPGYRFLSNFVCEKHTTDPIGKIAEYVREKAPTATKLNTYLIELNPSMNVHNVYQTTQHIPDCYRESFTRLRLMSHSLRVETGRWNRTPRPLRTCSCDDESIQTEQHVLISCTLTEQCRQNYNMLDLSSISTLLREDVYINELCKYIHEVLKSTIER